MPDDTFHPGPTVVFVDDAQWECFLQLAVILRKAGIRTVRVSVGLSRWYVDQILFDRYVRLPFPPTPEQLADILSSECVTDVQPTESLAMTTYAALNLLPASQRPDIWIGRSAFLDKWKVASTLRGLGIPTPDALLAEFTSPIEAVAQLSLPIVLKRRVGSSGSGVEVFDSIESLEQFVSRIEVLSDWFYERFIHGQSLVCAMCVGNEGIDVIATYEILKRVRLRGSSTVVEILNDARTTENGRTLINATHIRGLVCFDVIQDSNDIDWIHDVNPRAFGSFLTCQLGGFDFCGAYVRYITGRGNIEPSRVDASGHKSFVFPYGMKEVFRSGQLGTAWFRTLQWTWRYWRLLGFRYFLSLAIRGLVFSFRRNWERLGLRRHSSMNRPMTDPAQIKPSCSRRRRQ
jgi:hypothetical protein